MKEIKYDGSITEDISLAKQPEQDMNKKFKKYFYILLGICAFCLGMHFIFGALGSTYALIIVFASNSINLYSTSVRNKVTSFNKRRFDAFNRLQDFVFGLMKENANKKDVQGVVSYDNLMDAVILESKEETDEKKHDDGVETVISDLYFVDSQNQIKALREIKRVLTFPEEKNGLMQKIINVKMPNIVMSSKLMEFEEKDFPEDLPVQHSLKLK